MRLRSLLASAASITLLAAAALAIALRADAAQLIDWSKAQAVEIRMTEYKFIPDQLTLRHGQPYRLHLVNAGEEAHDFTAPDFFRAAIVRDADVFNETGSSVFLEPEQAVDIYVVAQKPGLFAPRCADHDWAGMTATFVIE